MSFQVPGMVLKGLEVGQIMANCYIVGSVASREALVIDPGDEAEAIMKVVADDKLDIKQLALTHAHFDHFGALGQLKKATSATFMMHKDDVASISASRHRHPSVDELPPPDKLLQGGDSIQVGEFSFLVLHTPGHSPGGICLYGHGIVFTGDTLFNSSIGRYDFPGSSGVKLMDSITTKLMVLPDETLVLPGHGPASTIGNERRYNPFLQPGANLI